MPSSIPLPCLSCVHSPNISCLLGWAGCWAVHVRGHRNKTVRKSRREVNSTVCCIPTPHGATCPAVITCW